MTLIDLAKEAEKRKEEIESTRNLPLDLMAKVKELGLVKMWATKECGGSESSVSDVSKVIQNIAYYNGSLAWVIGVTGCSSLFTGFMNSNKAMPIFKKRDAMIGGFAGPSGIATKDREDLLVTGQWSWGSGISHCSHIVGGVRIMDGDQIKGTAIVFFEPEEIDMIDNWYVLGLKGSHSIDYKAKNIKIPKNRWSRFPVQKPIYDAPLYRFSFLGALSVSVASVGLGLAKRALDEIKILAQKKSPFGVGKTLSKKPEIQAQIAKIEANYLAAKSLLGNTILDAEKETRDSPCSVETKARIRLATVHATTLCHQVVQESFRIGGGSSVWNSHKLAELLRDINVVSQHGMVSAGNYRTAGSVFLGNDVPEILL